MKNDLRMCEGVCSPRLWKYIGASTNSSRGSLFFATSGIHLKSFVPFYFCMGFEKHLIKHIHSLYKGKREDGVVKKNHVKTVSKQKRLYK